MNSGIDSRRLSVPRRTANAVTPGLTTPTGVVEGGRSVRFGDLSGRTFGH